MKAFDQVLETTERLLGPGGCPWDQEQTMKSTRPCIIEEACELVEALDSEDNSHIQEELGDLFFVVLFLCKLAEKEHRCTLNDVLNHLNEKLVRRHPHVFGDVKIEDSEGVLRIWGEIKNKEKGKTQRKSILDGIPKGLPALSRAQKVLKKIGKTDLTENHTFNDEDSLGHALLALVGEAQSKNLDAEHALRKVLGNLESRFREDEALNK